MFVRVVMDVDIDAIMDMDSAIEDSVIEKEFDSDVARTTYFDIHYMLKRPEGDGDDECPWFQLSVGRSQAPAQAE